MQYQSYQKSNIYITLWGNILAASGTVDIMLLKDDDILETLIDSTCSGSSILPGLYYWNSENITTQPTEMTEYVYWMEDGISNMSEPVKVVIGGYVDEIRDINTTVSGIDVKADTILSDTGGIAVGVGDVEGKTDTIISDTTYISTVVSGIDTKSDTILSDTGGIAAGVGGIDTKSDTILSDTGYISTVVSGIDTKSDTILSDTGGIAAGVGDVEGKTDIIIADTTYIVTTVSGINVEADYISSTVSGTDVKVDGLISTVSGIDVRTLLTRKCHTNRLELADGDSGNWVLYDDDDSTVLLTFSVTDKNGSSVIQQANIPSKRTKAV